MEGKRPLPKPFILVGAGGHGRETMEFVAGALETSGVPVSSISFAAERGYETEAGEHISKPLDAIFENEEQAYFNIAIANAEVRQRISEACIAKGFTPISLFHPTSVISTSANIAEGCIASAFTTISPQVKIGRFFHCNVYSYVAHDCVIGDFVTFGPRVCCTGNVHVKDHAFVGAGAIIRNGDETTPIVVGAGSFVGMGAVVTRDVPPGAVVVGNPARPVQGREQ